MNKKFDLREKFVVLTNEKLGAEVSSLDFSNSITVAGIINNWVSEKTDGLINEIISPDKINADSTLMTLVTAILFKGKWKEKFETSWKHSIFRSLSGKTQEVEVRADFMEQINLFGHYEDENKTQVIDIPYQDDLKMTIIMPEGNLYEFESGLSTEKMKHYFQNVSVTFEEIILAMPKFKFEVTYDLKKE